MNKKIVIDGDSILYRVSFRGEELGETDDVIDDTVEDDGMGGMTGEDPEYAYSGDHKLHLPTSYEAVDWAIKEIVQSWITELLCEDDTITSIEIYMTGKTGRLHCDGLQPNFRHLYVDDYKAQRKDSRPPAGLQELWAYIFTVTECEGLPVKVYVGDGCEADDIVVYLKNNFDDVLIAALDKDVLYQSVGKHYNYGKKEFVEVDELEARKYLYFQMIAGDPSDGYKGVPRVGKVGANKALQGLTEEKDMWEATLNLYKSKGLGLGEALQTGILASMHQCVGVHYDGVWCIPELNIFKAIK